MVLLGAGCLVSLFDHAEDDCSPCSRSCVLLGMGFNGIHLEESCERIVDQILAGCDVACWSRRREGGGGEAAGIPSGPGSKVGFNIIKGLC